MGEEGILLMTMMVTVSQLPGLVAAVPYFLGLVVTRLLLQLQAKSVESLGVAVMDVSLVYL